MTIDDLPVNRFVRFSSFEESSRYRLCSISPYADSCDGFFVDRVLIAEFSSAESSLTLEQLVHSRVYCGPADVVYSIENFDYDLDAWRFVGLYHYRRGH